MENENKKSKSKSKSSFETDTMKPFKFVLPHVRDKDKRSAFSSIRWGLQQNTDDFLMDMLWTETDREGCEILRKHMKGLFSRNKWSTLCFVCDICRSVIDENCMLAHLLYDHGLRKPICLLESFYNKWNVTVFSLRQLRLHETVCLDVSVFPDPNHRTDIVNRFLEGGDNRFNQHLPIAIMCCLTTWTHMQLLNGVKGLKENDSEFYQIVIVWLVTTRTRTTIRATVTLSNSNYTRTRRQRLLLLHMSKSQALNVFNESECIVLPKTEINRWTDNRIDRDPLINVEYIVDDGEHKNS